MKKTSIFQIAIFAVAGVAIVAGVVIFAFIRTEQGAEKPIVTMWGTLDKQRFDRMVAELNEEQREDINVVYEQVDPETFDQVFTEALAEGRGPDIVMLPHDLILKHQNKLLSLSYEFYPARTFKNTFIEEGELFTHHGGILGLPFMVDPLVMYWNRTMFTNAGIANPPQYWNEVVSITPDLTESDSNFTLFKSAVALGEFRNVDNAKEIFITLVMQAGNPLLIRDDSDSTIFDRYRVTLDERLGYTIKPTEAALNFFAQFSNPSRDVYSWNRALASSQDRFVSDDLAIYLGFASELDTIRLRNPNLNFDVAEVPSSRTGGSETFGKLTGLSISRTATDPNEAFRVISVLTDRVMTTKIADELGLPPVRRDLLTTEPADPFATVFNSAALKAKAVYEVDPDVTEDILQDMVEAYTSGRMRASEAVTRAHNELKAIVE